MGRGSGGHNKGKQAVRYGKLVERKIPLMVRIPEGLHSEVDVHALSYGLSLNVAMCHLMAMGLKGYWNDKARIGTVLPGY